MTGIPHAFLYMMIPKNSEQCVSQTEVFISREIPDQRSERLALKNVHRVRSTVIGFLDDVYSIPQ